jgi:predicted DCC family thiol-disulfide oxidoreductase YuxK
MSEGGKTTVYYNSACPVCRSGVAAQQGAMAACEIEWIDVHANPEAVRALGVDIEAVREKLYVRDADGRVQVGADAFATLWSRTRGLRSFARLLAFPRVRAFAQCAYDAFARRLYRWNRRRGRW